MKLRRKIIMRLTQSIVDFKEMWTKLIKPTLNLWLLLVWWIRFLRMCEYTTIYFNRIAIFFQLLDKQRLHPYYTASGVSVARTFLSEIADFGWIYRQIRQTFGPKSRKIRQFLDLFYILITPYLKKFPFLLHFYSLIFSFFF